ncbi:MAG TPA: hypothetical protein VK186_10170 [Candidatus Deferrimicrobium sp.]|nr:hypothetical protein [Candidatus Deferrimicrobium sp.]
MQQNKRINKKKKILLEEQLILECEAMAKYAFASGLVVPGKTIQVLESFSRKKAAVEEPAGDAAGITETNGVDGLIPDIRPLIGVHEKLVKIVEPAKPRTILLLDEERQQNGIFKFLGPVAFIRRMILAAIICLVLFVFISLSPEIGNQPGSWNLFESSGWSLLLKELFLLSAAGLGASFTALFKANRYIIEGTFDPKYESSYWIRFSLGFIAGMILATLIPIEKSLEADFGKPLLAMLGGFSADLVYRIISRVIESLESLFRGDNKSLLQAQKQNAMARAAEEDAQNRFKVAANLMKVQQDIDAGMNPEDVKKKMGKLMDDMVGVDTVDTQVETDS